MMKVAESILSAGIFIYLFCSIGFSAVQTDIGLLGTVDYSPSSPKRGDKITVKVTLVNNGIGDIVGPIKVNWYLNKSLLRQTVTMGLKASETKQISTYFSAKSNTYNIKIEIVTRMVPYSDTDISNNVVSAQLKFPFEAVSDTSGALQQVGSIAGKTGGPPGSREDVRSPERGKKASGSSSHVASESAGSKERNEASGQSPSGSGKEESGSASNRESASTETSDDDDGISQAFVKYLAAYTRSVANLQQLSAKEENSDKKLRYKALITDLKSLNSKVIKIANSLSSGKSDETTSLNTELNLIGGLALKISNEMKNFEALEDNAELIFERAKEFVIKVKDSLK